MARSWRPLDTQQGGNLVMADGLIQELFKVESLKRLILVTGYEVLAENFSYPLADTIGLVVGVLGVSGRLSRREVPDMDVVNAAIKETCLQSLAVREGILGSAKPTTGSNIAQEVNASIL